jgi:hypothetical protein
MGCFKEERNRGKTMKINLIPERNNKPQTKCVNCGQKFDLVSAIFVPLCNDCRKKQK